MTDPWIQELANKPNVKKSASVWTCVVSWIALSACLTLAGTFVLGIRYSAFSMLSMWDKVIELSLLIALCVISAANAFLLSVPGEELHFRYRTIRWVLAAFVMFLLFDAYVMDKTPLVVSLHWGCAADIVLLGIPSAALLFYMLSRSANTLPKWSGYLACLAAFSMAAIGSRYTCMDVTSLHFLVWHFIPVVLLGMAGFGLGQRLLKL